MKTNSLTLKDLVTIEGSDLKERARKFSQTYISQLKDTGVWDLWMVVENICNRKHIEK